jgi:hypothetical protein
MSDAFLCFDVFSRSPELACTETALGVESWGLPTRPRNRFP